jgi:Fe2+ transport system protein FeoA
MPPAPDSLPLSDLRRGRSATVIEIVGDDELSQRLASAGLWPEVRIESLGRAPFGDPLLFRLHGYRLALRRAEAQRVRVREAS